MLKICGPIAIRQPNTGFMKAGEIVLGHQHNFPHPTFVTHGALEISLLDVQETDGKGRPLKATVSETFVIRASDEQNFLLIQKGRFHKLTALEDGTRYQCIYPHRLEQAVTLHAPGQQHEAPFTKRDENGVLWIRIDEKIVEEATGFAEAYV